MIRTRSGLRLHWWATVCLAICLALTPDLGLAETEKSYQVVIAGGSTAALAAAFTAAEEGATVALLEPTDWIGGQLTSSGVPAVDEAWHQVKERKAADEGESFSGELLVNVSAIARDPRNMTPFFREALEALPKTADGWVSRYCFEPRDLLNQTLEPRAKELSSKLTIYHDTVVKRVETDGRVITAIHAIRRTPREGIAENGYDRLPSEDLTDWYSEEDSPRFTKKVLRFEGAIFVDATEWGEVLALSGAPMVQGVEYVDGETDADDTCGQSITFGFVQRMHAEPQDDHPKLPKDSALGFGAYRNREDAWQKIWTYRRIRGLSAEAAPGDLSLQNWGFSVSDSEGGNDYPYKYLFLSREDTTEQCADWVGGVDLEVMANAEKRALAWHDWFRRHGPEEIDPDQITLAGDVLGTGHGLSKLPYIRDTRRSVGVDGFLLKFEDLIGPNQRGPDFRATGAVFEDRVALGAYAADIHPLAFCTYPPYVHVNHPTLPFYIPLRALTNDGYDNLLVAGKTMAQTFLANSATRLHPIEWSSGVAAGVFAADLVESGNASSDAWRDYDRLRERVAKHTPVDWVIEEGLAPGLSDSE